MDPIFEIEIECCLDLKVIKFSSRTFVLVLPKFYNQNTLFIYLLSDWLVFLVQCNKYSEKVL